MLIFILLLVGIACGLMSRVKGIIILILSAFLFTFLTKEMIKNEIEEDLKEREGK